MAWSGSEDQFADFIDNYGLTFPQISDDGGEVFARFEIPTQPAFALVFPDGEVQVLFGAADPDLLDSLISKAIA